MLVGDLVVSIYPTTISFELFVKKKKVHTLVGKHVEKYTTPFASFNKIDAMDISVMVADFLKTTHVKTGIIHIILHTSNTLNDFVDYPLDGKSKKELKQMLPIEIESTGEHLLGLPYKYTVANEIVYVHFMQRNLADSFNHFDVGNGWQVETLITSVAAYQGLFQKEGILVEIGDTTYTIYCAKDGYITAAETFDVYNEYSLDRPENPTEQNLFGSIKEDLVDFVTRYRFDNDSIFDLVYLNFAGELERDFVAEDIDGILYSKPDDLRQWLDVETDLEKYRSVSYTKQKQNYKNFDYSTSALGFFYAKSNRDAYNFAPKRMSATYKKLLYTSLSFAGILAILLPTSGILMDKHVEDALGKTSGYVQEIKTLETSIKDVEQQISDKDKIVNDYNSYVSSLGELTNMNRNFISNVLSYLPSNTPTTIVLNDVKLLKDSKTLELKGVSQNYKDIGALAIELEEFGTVSIDTIENNDLVNEQGYPFKITLSSK